jgi:hypothetical protein
VRGGIPWITGSLVMSVCLAPAGPVKPMPDTTVNSSGSHRKVITKGARVRLLIPLYPS